MRRGTGKAQPVLVLVVKAGETGGETGGDSEAGGEGGGTDESGEHRGDRGNSIRRSFHNRPSDCNTDVTRSR